MNSQEAKSASIGVDTGKLTLDIYIRPHGEFFSVKNDVAGIKEAIKKIKSYHPIRIVIEATGRLEWPFVEACLSHQLPIIVANPLQIGRFAGAIGQQAKTDKLDAKLIAHFGEAVQPEVTPIKQENVRLISDLLARRRQLIEMSTMEKNRLQIMPKLLHKGIERLLKLITKQIDEIESELEKQIDATIEWKEKRDILQSVPGVGKVLTYALLSDLPELGELTNKEVAALVGVAPFNKESGMLKGKRSIRGGRSRVRTVLYMAMMSAVQCNPTFKRHYEQLKAAGKPAKVALVACMRKLIVALNSMVRHGTYWNEKVGSKS